MDSLPDLLVQADNFVLFVLVSFVVGSGVRIGRNLILPVAGYGILSFWGGFRNMVVWSIATAAVLALLAPFVAGILVANLAWIPAANAGVLTVTAFSMARQAGMVHRATVGIAVGATATAVFAFAAGWVMWG